MAFILYLLLLILVYYTGVALWRIYSVYRKLRETTKRFRDFNGAQNSSAYGSRSERNGGYGNDSNSGNGSGGGYSNGNWQRTTTTASGDVVEDRRSEYEINRKIFTKEEGEYIDFEEQ